MSTPLEQADEFKTSLISEAHQSHSSRIAVLAICFSHNGGTHGTNDSVAGGPGEPRQNLDGADVFRIEVDIETLPPGLELWLQSHSPSAEYQGGGTTLEDHLALWQITEHSEKQPRTTQSDVSTAQDMNRLKLAIIRAIAVLSQERFKQSWKQEDLDLEIDFETRGLQLALDNGPERTEWLSQLGGSYLRRFQQLGNLEDLRRGIELTEQVVLHMLDNHPGKPAYLSDLGLGYEYRFKHLGREDDLDRSVNYFEQAVILTPDGHPDRPAWLNRLGISYKHLFERLGRLDDLHRSVSCNERTVILTPDGHPDKPGGWSNLGASYKLLFQHLGRLDDLHRSVNCVEQAVSLTPDGHPGKPGWLDNLGNSYKLLFEHIGRLDDLHRSVNCQERAFILTPDGHPDKLRHLNNLGISYQLLFERLGRLGDLDRSMNCRWQAAIMTPDDHPDKPGHLNNLGISYQLLFEHLGRLDDLDRSVNCIEQSVTLTPDGHPDKPGHLNNLAGSYQLLFQHLGRLDDLDRSVNCIEQSVTLTPDGHPDKPHRLNNLGISYQLLFQHLGRLDDLHRSVNCQEKAVILTPDGHINKPRHLRNLGSSCQLLFWHLGRLDDLDRSVNWYEQAVTLTPDGHVDKPGHLNSLGASYATRFRHLGRLEDANHASGYFKQAEQLTPDGHPDKSHCFSALGNLHLDMFEHLQLPLELLLNGIHYHKSAALTPTGAPTLRLRSSHEWARLSHLSQLPSLEAYAHCMTLLPLVVWLGTAVQQRYECLTREIGSLITEAAAAAISGQQYTLAVEWLEQGRSIVWGQTLQLRTPYDDLHAIQPELSKELHDVSYQLECSQASGDDGKYEIAWKHRRLAERREELLVSARLLPGLEDFLRPLKAPKIMDLIRHGIAVMVNVHEDRCDALVIQAGTQEITHVPLTGFSVHKAKRARNCLSAHGSRRGFKLDDNLRIATFNDVLAMLWHDVAKPVLDHIGITEVLRVDELPHITWCTTGPLSFLPLHAAGDYSHPSSVLSNLAISSYAPTISSLGERAVPQGSFSGILAIGHASSIRGLNALPGTRAELDRVEKQAGTLPFTRLDEEKACTDAVLKAMQDHSWVHFACHGSQNALDPMKSALHLHDGDLDLATIARNPVKNAQLAFLSACQTATGDSDLPDESIHLAAGLLMAGYSSVIATMWSIDDGDAPLVAEKVYECLLEGGVPNSRKAALALHKAVASLRETIGVDEFTRWVPYIHIGR